MWIKDIFSDFGEEKKAIVFMECFYILRERLKYRVFIYLMEKFPNDKIWNVLDAYIL